MLTEKDLIDFSEFTEEEIEIIAEYEDEPVVLSIAHTQMLLTQNTDEQTVKLYLQNALTNALSKGHLQQAQTLEKIVNRYEEAHPTSARSG